MTISTRSSQAQSGALIIGALLVLALFAAALGWHHVNPVFSKWEHLHFFFLPGSVDPHLTFRLHPRANLGGTGYATLEIGKWITDFFGWSLPTFRAISFLFAGGTLALIAVVLGRWFGLYPALAGVILAAFSTGYIIFANQVLVSLPTLFFSVLLVERFQRLDTAPRSKTLHVMLGIVLAFCFLQYGMARYFALIWVAFFFGTRIFVVCRQIPGGAARQAAILGVFKSLAAIGIVALVTLSLLDLTNVRLLLHPWNILFPAKAEVETKALSLFATFVGNFPRLLEMYFPFISVSGGGRPEFILAGQRAPLYEYWHTPFLLIGLAVAIRRTFRPLTPTVYPYLSLHVICGATILLSLASQIDRDIYTISIFRNFSGFFAVSAYIAVALIWLWERIGSRIPAATAVFSLGFLAILSTATIILDQKFNAMQNRIADMAAVDTSGQSFAPTPSPLPFGLDKQLYQQARFTRLAEILADLRSCKAFAGPLLVKLSPGLVLNNGEFDGIHYTKNYNMLSSTLAFLLADHGINGSHVILVPEGDPGIREFGNGYAGAPRHFSGPITWKNAEILYPNGLLKRHYRESRPGNGDPWLVAFSEAEVEASRAQFKQMQLPFREIGPITDLSKITPLKSRDFPAICSDRP